MGRSSDKYWTATGQDWGRTKNGGRRKAAVIITLPMGDKKKNDSFNDLLERLDDDDEQEVGRDLDVF